MTAGLRVWPAHERCPNCGDILIRRVPRKGKSFEPFWGCRSYPECNYTTPDDNGEPWKDLNLDWILEED